MGLFCAANEVGVGRNLRTIVDDNGVEDQSHVLLNGSLRLPEDGADALQTYFEVTLVLGTTSQNQLSDREKIF